MKEEKQELVPLGEGAKAFWHRAISGTNFNTMAERVAAKCIAAVKGAVTDYGARAKRPVTGYVIRVKEKGVKKAAAHKSMVRIYARL